MRQKEKLTIATAALRTISNLTGVKIASDYAKQVCDELNPTLKPSDSRRLLRVGSIWRCGYGHRYEILTVNHVTRAVYAKPLGDVANGKRIECGYSEWDRTMTYRDADNPGHVSSHVTDAPNISGHLLRVGAIWRNDAGTPHEILEVTKDGRVISREIATQARNGYTTALDTWARNMTYRATDNMPAMRMRKETSTEGTASTPASRQPTNEQIAEMKPGSRWVHYNGKIYTISSIANKSSRNPKYPQIVVYTGENGEVWARPLNDWHRSMTLRHELKINISVDYAKAFDDVMRDTDIKAPAFGSVWRSGGGNPYCVERVDGNTVQAYSCGKEDVAFLLRHRFIMTLGEWRQKMRFAAPRLIDHVNGRDDTHHTHAPIVGEVWRHGVIPYIVTAVTTGSNLKTRVRASYFGDHSMSAIETPFVDCGIETWRNNYKFDAVATAKSLKPAPHPLADLLPLIEAIHDKTIMPHNEELKMNLRMAAYKLAQKIRGA